MALLLLLIISGCKLDADKKIERDKLTFKIGTDTQLFFKNVRQSYYDLEENKEARFNVFRFSERSINPHETVLNLAIVVNYLQDEAYLLVEPSEALANEAIILKAEHATTKDTVSLNLEEVNRESMLELCTDVYELLVQGYEFQIKEDGMWKPIFNTPQTKNAFRVTVSDYYRLTRVF